MFCTFSRSKNTYLCGNLSNGLQIISNQKLKDVSNLILSQEQLLIGSNYRKFIFLISPYLLKRNLNSDHHMIHMK